MGIADATTDSNGDFALDLSNCSDCPPGTQLFVKVNSDYGFGEKMHNIALNNRPITIAIPHNNELIISGRVKDSKTGTFLKGIQVSPIILGVQVTPIETDDFGQFEFIFNKWNTGLGQNQAINLAFKDTKNGAYKDLEGWFPVSLPIPVLMEKADQPRVSYNLKIGKDATTGIRVKKGETIIIKASGSIEVGSFVGTSAPGGIEGNKGPLGISLKRYNYFSTKNHGALCYRFNSLSNTWICYSNKQENKYKIQQDGRIEFKINDNDQGNNHGHYEVEIIIK